MKKTVFLLGGARSGKSFYAQELAKQMAEAVLFVATATAGDEDMHRRIKKHQQDRPQEWHTLEAPFEVGKQIEDTVEDEELVIIDCLTLLVNNIFCRHDETQFDNIEDSLLEKEVITEIKAIISCIKKVDASFIIVSNEVGLGLVPDNRMGRLYRDILGRANQMIGQAADEVYLMVAGIPLRVKPQK